jgi:hypothetical protein
LPTEHCEFPVSNREDVEHLRRRLEEFRRTHAVRSRLPEELWAAAAKLARRDGIEATAQGWMWIGREPTAAAFVELLAGNSGTAASCLVEVESPRGAKLRLELKAIPTSALAELIRAFAAS